MSVPTENMLFYSRKCKACADLFSILEKNEMLCHFKLYCIDDMQNIPSCIKIIPTMIIARVPKPFVANEAFVWVEQYLKFRSNKIMESRNKGDPLGYIRQEMGGFSDDFALIKIDQPLAHCYFNVGDEEKNAIYTGEEIDKLNNSEAQEKLNEERNTRRNQDTIIKKHSMEIQKKIKSGEMNIKDVLR